MTTYSNQLVLPKLVKTPGQRVTAESVRGSMQPATTAASVRQEAQLALMEEWDGISYPGTAGDAGSRGNVCSLRTSSAGSVRGRLSVGTATFMPTAPPRNGSRTKDASRKVSRQRKVARATTDHNLVPCPYPSRQVAGRQSSAKQSSMQPGASSERPSSDPGAVGVINGVPFQTVSGGFGALVDQWLTTSSKALSPKVRRSATTQSGPRQKSTKQKVRMRRAVDMIGSTGKISSMTMHRSSTGRGTRAQRIQSQGQLAARSSRVA